MEIPEKERKFICNDCGKVFELYKYLAQHIKNKKIPCNFVCRICDKECNNRILYAVHMKNVHFEKEKMEKMEKKIEELDAKFEKQEADAAEKRRKEEADAAEKQRKEEADAAQKQKEKVYPIPIDDFNIKRFKELPSGYVILDVSQEEENMSKAIMNVQRTNSDTMQLQKYDKKFTLMRERIVVGRTQEARNEMPDDLILSAVRIFAETINRAEIARMTKETLQKSVKEGNSRLHNICLTDASRGTIRVYERKKSKNIYDMCDKECHWVAYPKSKAPELVINYAKTLFEILLDAGSKSMQSGIYKNKYPCIACTSNSTMDAIILYEKNMNVISPKCVNKSALNLKIRLPNDVVNKLRANADRRKCDILTELRKIVLLNSEVIKFLNDCRPLCLKTFKDTFIY